MQFLIFVITILLAALVLWFPVSPATGHTLFAAIGDYGDGSGDEGGVAGLVDGWNPAFVISLGDNRYGSTSYDQTVGQFYCNVLADAGNGGYCSGGDSPVNAFFPSLGNHDYSDGSGLNEYLNYFTLPGTGITGSGTSGSERYYDFVMGPVHFFVVDSAGALNSNSDRTAQMNWLQGRLARSTSPWQIVYFHHPPYSSATHGSTPGMQWPFAAWGADAVLSGHDHSYERISADGIVYFVNGLGGRSLYAFNSPVPGSQVRYNSDYGAMRIDTSDSAITFEFINVSGNIIDSYTLQAAANAGPTADFAYSCTDLACDFTDASTDSDGSVSAWSWDFGDGGHSSTRHPSHSYSAAGSFTVSLTATDNNGTDDGTSRTVTVTAPAASAAPTAAFTYSCTDLTCDFTDTSTDSDGSVSAWSWDFGDGGHSSTQHPSHSYSAAGSFTVSLTVADNNGTDDGTSHTVTVTTPAGGNNGGSGGGCTLREAAAIDPFWQLVLTASGLGLVRRRRPPDARSRHVVRDYK